MTIPVRSSIGSGRRAAIATYRQAVRENPRRIETHRALAAAYRRLGREAEAKLEDEVVRKLFPPAER